MADHRNPFDYPINPSFGQGIFRRKIRLRKIEGGVAGDLEDCNHGFSIRLYYNNNVVTAIEGEAKRIPFSTCAGAATALQSLIGTRTETSPKNIISTMNLNTHCTHWLDLAILCISHATRNEPERIYEANIPDEATGPTNAQVLCNGKLALDWHVRDWKILQPTEHKDNTLFKGFASWANGISNQDEREAAFVLQKAYFVSRARRFDIQAVAGEPANKHTIMRGACYSYSEPQVDIAKRTSGTVRDFTDHQEQLLKFQ